MQFQQKKEKEEKRVQIIRQLPLLEKDSQRCTTPEKHQTLVAYQCLKKIPLSIPSLKG